MTRSIMEPLTPGITIVADAITPTPNSFSTFTRPRLRSAALPSVSPSMAIPITMAKKIRNTIPCPILILLPFTFLNISGSPPTMSPINSPFVCSGKCSNAGVITNDSPASATIIPSMIGSTKRMLSLNSLNRCVRQWISLS